MQWDNIAIMIFSFTSFFKWLVAYPTRRIPVPEPQATSRARVTWWPGALRDSGPRGCRRRQNHDTNTTLDKRQK